MMLLVGVFRSVNCLIQASEIEVDAFHLCLKQIDHDVRLMRVWQEKYATFESAMFFKKHDWLRLRNDELQTEAKKVLSSFVQIQVLESETETMAVVTQIKKRYLQQERLLAPWCCESHLPELVLSVLYPGITSEHACETSCLGDGRERQQLWHCNDAGLCAQEGAALAARKGSTRSDSQG